MYGANKSLCQLMIELKNDYSITPIVLLRSKGDICNYLDDHKIRYIVSHFYWWVYEGSGIKNRLHNIVKLIRNYSRINKIASLIKNEKIDLVYSNSITINIGVFLSKKLHCLHIWHIRESLEQFSLKLSLGSFFSKIFLKQGTEKYISISDFITQSFTKLLPLDKVEKIYNGILIDTDKQKNIEYEGLLNICITGIVGEQKNQLEAIKALKILIKDKGYSNIKLHIFGNSKADYLKVLEDYTISNDLSNSIIFHGHIAHLNDVLNNMHLGLVCARDEAFGRVSVEYMLNHLPIIASRSGANEELVKEGLNGTLYDLYNIEELVEKIELFIKNPKLLQSMGASAYSYALENFNSHKNTKAIYKIISTILN